MKFKPFTIMSPKARKEFTYQSIVARLKEYGYEWGEDGNLHRYNTGCMFYNKSLRGYKSFEQFIADYPCYSF